MVDKCTEGVLNRALGVRWLRPFEVTLSGVPGGAAGRAASGAAGLAGRAAGGSWAARWGVIFVSPRTVSSH